MGGGMNRASEPKEGGGLLSWSGSRAPPLRHLGTVGEACKERFNLGKRRIARGGMLGNVNLGGAVVGYGSSRVSVPGIGDLVPRRRRRFAWKGKVMTALTRWNPLKEMEDIQNRMSRFFGVSPVATINGDREAMTVAEWSPSVDITEDEKEYLVKVDLPEVKKEDVKVSVENGVLAISGERKLEKEEKGKKYHRIERSYGSFMRSFALPESTDGSKVTAEYKDGLLRVHLPKSEQAKPRAVEVKVA